MAENIAVSEEVNRLYWQTDDSVAEISNALNVSRRALYELIQPAPADTACANCGSDMHFVNRSAKANGLARCSSCGAERQIDDSYSDADVGTIPPYEAGLPAVSDERADDMRHRFTVLASLAVAGAVVGALSVMMIRRRR